jgi:hypothetical protein
MSRYQFDPAYRSAVYMAEMERKMQRCNLQRLATETGNSRDASKGLRHLDLSGLRTRTLTILRSARSRRHGLPSHAE